MMLTVGGKIDGARIRVRRVTSIHTFEKYRDKPPTSIAILLQKYALFLVGSSICTTHSYVGESLRGNTIGATGPRASERKSASERVSEREVFRVFFRGLERFLEVLRGF